MDFCGTDGLIDACMMDGRNELMDAFFLFVSLARFLAEDSYGKKLRNVLLVFWLFFGHEDYGMPFSAATILPADDAVDVDVGDDVDGDRPPQDGRVMTHKCRGSIVVLSVSKSVEPNEEQKEMISSFQQGILCKH